MLSLVQTTLASFAGLIVLSLWKIWPMLSRAYTSPLRNLSGPPSPSWFYGNIKAIQDEDNSVPQEHWAAEYGPVISYKGFFGVRRRVFWRSNSWLNSGLFVAQPPMDDGHSCAQSYSHALDRLPEVGGGAQECGENTWERLVTNTAQETCSSAVPPGQSASELVFDTRLLNVRLTLFLALRCPLHRRYASIILYNDHVTEL